MIWILANWRLLTLIGVAVAVGGYIVTLTVQRNNARTKAENIQLAFDQFQAKVRVEGEEAKLRYERRAAEERENKEKLDAVNAKERAGLVAELARVRNARANSGSGGLSAPAPSPASLERTCFDPARLSAALRSLDEGILGIVEGCSKAVIDLDTAKKWAHEP